MYARRKRITMKKKTFGRAFGRGLTSAACFALSLSLVLGGILEANAGTVDTYLGTSSQLLVSDNEPVLFAEDMENDASASKLQIVAQVKAYIREHLSEKLTLADVAAVFNFSPGYLSQLFGRYGGGFVEYITEVRVAAAKEMLEKGDKKIYEIAEELGFESSFYFSKVFKKATGLSPREYQQKL